MTGLDVEHRNLQVKRHKPQKGEVEIETHHAGAEQPVVALKLL